MKKFKINTETVQWWLIMVYTDLIAMAITIAALLIMTVFI